MGEPAYLYLCRKLMDSKEKGEAEESRSEKIYSRYGHSPEKKVSQTENADTDQKRLLAMREAEDVYQEMKVISSEIKEAYQKLIKKN